MSQLRLIVKSNFTNDINKTKVENENAFKICFGVSLEEHICLQMQYLSVYQTFPIFRHFHTHVHMLLCHHYDFLFYMQIQRGTFFNQVASHNIIYPFLTFNLQKTNWIWRIVFSSCLIAYKMAKCAPIFERFRGGKQKQYLETGNLVINYTVLRVVIYCREGELALVENRFQCRYYSVFKESIFHVSTGGSQSLPG